MLEGVEGQQRGEQVREADVMLMISKIPPSASSIVLLMKSSEPMKVLLSKKPDMISRLQAMIEDRMAITRVAATRHFLPVRAPPMVSPPVTKKNTELTIPTDSPNIQLSNTHPLVLAMRTMMPYIMLRMPIVVEALVA